MTTRALRRHVVASLLALGCLLPRGAFADRISDERSARAIFEEGRLLAKNGRFEEACRKFERSLALDRGLGTRFNLADCWEHVGEKQKAHSLFVEVADKAHAAGQDDREKVARARAALLEPKPPEPVVASEPVVAPAPAVAAVPAVVISGRDDAARDRQAAIDVMSSQLQTEYGTLAGATATLRDLTIQATALARAAPRGAKARKVGERIAVLKRQLDDTWTLAGEIATQLARREQPTPRELATSASDTKLVAAPAPAVTGAVASVPGVTR